MGWSALTLVSDVDLWQLEPETGAAAHPLGAIYWADQRMQAKRDLKIWLELDFADVPGVADRVRDTWGADYVFGYTGAAYTDYTTAARDDSTDDVPLTSIYTTAANDRLYVGALWEFEALALTLTGTKNAAASTLSAYYSGPAGWTALTLLSDGTKPGSVSLAQSGRLTWEIPETWQRQRLNGTSDEYYWLELRVSATLTGSVTATQVTPVRAPDALRRCAAYLALYHVYNGLAAGAASPESWQTKADKYWDQARSLYTSLKNQSGLWIDLSRDEAITAEEGAVRAPFVFARG